MSKPGIATILAIALFAFNAPSATAQVNHSKQEIFHWMNFNVTFRAPRVEVCCQGISKQARARLERFRRCSKSKALHPAFYGCYDWHSSVHGHWMLVRLLRMFPNLPEAGEIRKRLAQT